MIKKISTIFISLLILSSFVSFYSPEVRAANSLDDLRSILNNDPLGQTQRFGNLGGLVSGLLNIAFLIAGFLMFIWAFVGIFQYITAGGNKEGLAKARARVTWAIVGFLFVMAAFLISSYVQEVIQPKGIQFCSTQDMKNCNPPSTCVMINGQPQCQ